ncbi:MAG: hypothetical protein M3441_05285 [Chloroflexota bacterium]|nr:hypothetical protein [Chloroflexota bacterium]
MYLKLPHDVPEKAQLSELFGFTPPDAFLHLIQVLYEQSNGFGGGASDLFSAITGQELAGSDARYPSTPPELFPFVDMGVDGVHLGYVIHAPELNLRDYPVGEHSPMDPGGVYLVGNNTNEALENLMSEQLEYIAHDLDEAEEGPELEGRGVELIQRIAHLLDLAPDGSKADRRYGPEGNGLSVVPFVPIGWQYVPSSDGIGVLAPVEAFAPMPLELYDRSQLAEDYIQAADQAFAEGFPATALYYLRQGRWRHWTDDAANDAFSVRLIGTYSVLGRFSLAEVVERERVKQQRQRRPRLP